jgi:hypothetical protein
MPHRHLTPNEVEKLRERKIARQVAENPPHRADDGHAFVPDNSEGPARTDDDLAEDLAESYLIAAEFGEEQMEERSDEVEPEEEGGPYTLSTAHKEFAGGTDPENPPDATREPLPNTGRTGKPDDDKKPS